MMIESYAHVVAAFNAATTERDKLRSIVIALAEAGPFIDRLGRRCLSCETVENGLTSLRSRSGHEPSCPWRRAREATK